MVLKINMIGELHFFTDDDEIFFSFRKVQALACYLAVEKKVSREVLADLFWGDREDGLAARNLRNALYQLKKSIPDGFINSDRYWISMDKSSLLIDIDFFDLDFDIEWRKIVSYGKDFMDGFYLPGCPRFAAWQRQMSVSHVNRYSSFLRKYASLKLDKSDLNGALTALKVLTSTDEVDEEAYRLMMICYHRLGKKNKFLETYDLLCSRLNLELVSSPDKETEKLFNRILSEPDSTLNSDAGEKNSSTSSPGSFYGRIEELKKIEIFCSSESEKPKCIYISGEAGVGKSFLVKKSLEFFDPSSLYLFCGAVRGKNDYPLLAWNDLLEGLSEQADLNVLGLPQSMWSLLGESFPALKVMATSLQPGSPTRIGAILAVVFQKLSQVKPVILVMEDLQWFDKASMDVLESFLMHRPGNITLFMTARPKLTRRGKVTINVGYRSGRTELCNINLECFSMEETRDFCSDVFADVEVDDAKVEKIYRQTDGLPLFISETMMSISSGRSIDERSEKFSDVIEAHLMELDERERTLIECLSVFSLKAEWTRIRDLAQVDDLTLTQITERLRGLSLLAEKIDDSSAFYIEFKHVKVKDHVYWSMSRSRRRFLHGRLADIITEELSGRRWDDIICSRLIYHCRKAGMKLRDLEYTLQRLRFHIKLNYELFPLYTDELLKTSSTSFGDKAYSMKQLDIARLLLKELKREQTMGDKLHELETSFMAIKGGYLLWWGEYDQGKILVRTALGRASDRADCVMEGDCIQHLCYYGIQIEDGRLLSSYARRLIEVTGRCYNEPARAMGLRFLGMARIYMQEYQQARKSLEIAIRRFKEIDALDEPYTLQIIAAQSYIGDISHREGKLKEAYNIYIDCIESCNRGNFYRGLCLFHSNAAHVAYDMGNIKDMEMQLLMARRSLEGRGNSIVFSLMAWFEGQRGNDEEAIRLLSRADDLCIPLHKRHWLALQLYIKGCLKSDIDSNRVLAFSLPDQAVNYLSRSLELYRKMGVSHKVVIIEKRISSLSGNLQGS